MKVLIAGGAGFIGSTVASACADAGCIPVVLDNFSTGRREFARNHICYEADIADGTAVDAVFAEHPEIHAVVHCAALIVVPESVREPLRYYRENVGKTVEFLGHLVRNGCRRCLFSSSAAIYRPGDDLSVDEASPIHPASPYARGKAMVEAILRDCSGAHDLRTVSLRYFNPIGADPAMRTGLVAAHPSHVLGRLIDAATLGREFRITGTDWPTRDGTGVRDYIHVWDLAAAHVLALRRFDRIVPPGAVTGHRAINLGTGTGTTVRELLDAFAAVLGRPVPHRVAPRRDGDVPGCYARGTLAGELLGWRPGLSLEDGIRHSLKWSTVRHRVLDGGAAADSACSSHGVPPCAGAHPGEGGAGGGTSRAGDVTGQRPAGAG